MKKFILLFVLSTIGIHAEAQTWNQITTGTTIHLNAIDFPSSNVGYIVGDSSLILKTTDGGQTWNPIVTTGLPVPTFVELIDVDFVSESRGFVTSKYGGTFETLDGGLNWNIISLVSGVCSSSTFYIDGPDHFFAGGAGCFSGAMMDEYNSGTWTVPTLNYMSWDSQETIVEIDFGDTDTGLAVLYSDIVLRTTDGGSTWDSISTGLSPTGYLTSVKMVDNLLAYAGYNEDGGGFGILKTTDGGLTWIQDMGSATFFYPSFNCVTVAANGDVYSGATPSNTANGLIFETVDGINWIYELLDQSINGMTSYGDDVTFAVGDSGFIVVNLLPSTLSNNKLSYDQPRVYPNPAHDELIIDIAIDDESVLAVYTVSGRLVTVPMTNMGASVKLDVTLLPEGMYVIKFCDSKQISTIKFLKLEN